MRIFYAFGIAVMAGALSPWVSGQALDGGRVPSCSKAQPLGWLLISGEAHRELSADQQCD